MAKESTRWTVKGETYYNTLVRRPVIDVPRVVAWAAKKAQEKIVVDGCVKSYSWTKIRSETIRGTTEV